MIKSLESWIEKNTDKDKLVKIENWSLSGVEKKETEIQVSLNGETYLSFKRKTEN